LQTNVFNIYKGREEVGRGRRGRGREGRGGRATF